MCQLHRHNSFGKNLLHQTAKERKVPRKFDMRQTFCTVSFQFQWILLLSHSCRYHWVWVVGLRHNRNDTKIPCSLIILYAMENPIFKSKMKPNTERLTTAESECILRWRERENPTKDAINWEKNRIWGEKEGLEECRVDDNDDDRKEWTKEFRRKEKCILMSKWMGRRMRQKRFKNTDTQMHADSISHNRLIRIRNSPIHLVPIHISFCINFGSNFLVTAAFWIQFEIVLHNAASQRIIWHFVCCITFSFGH